MRSERRRTPSPWISRASRPSTLWEWLDGRAGAAVLLAAAFAFTLIGIRQGVSWHDEGLSLQAGRRVADGQWPYADFWWNYGPGHAVLMGLIDVVAGPSLLAWRIVRAVVAAVGALLAHRLARRHGASPGWAALAWAGAAGALAWPLTSAPTAYGLTLAFASLISAEDGAPRRAGILAGVAAWLRPELGIAAALGGGRRTWVPAAITAVLLWLPFLLRAPADLWRDVVGFTAVQDLQRLPFPLDYDGGPDPNKLLEFSFPAALVAGCALLVVRRPPWALIPLALAGLAYLLARTDEFHLVPLSAVLAVALAVAATRAPRAWAVALGAVLAVIVLHGLDRQAVRLKDAGATAPVPGPAGDGVRIAAREAADLRVLLDRLPPGPMVVLPPRLDRVSVGAPLLYVIAGRENPTRYDVMQPGVVTTARVQREIAADLRRVRPTVVRWLAPEASRLEDNGSARSSGVTLVDDLVRRGWRPASRSGPWVVLVPR